MQKLDGRGLVSTDWLAAHLYDRDLRVFDVTMHLIPATPGPFLVESGRAGHEAGHVPGAAFLDLANDLSDQHSSLKFTRPTVDALARAFAAAGVGSDTLVVTYSTTTPMWATRVWWMLKACGFDNAAVLDGGLAKWKAEGRPVEAGTRAYPPAEFTPTPKAGAWADKAEVLAAIDDDRLCIVNALPASIHRGDDATSWGRKGHITGSRNIPFETLLNADGTYRSDTELRALFESVGAFGKERAICYCGGGISATMDALALVRLGHPSVGVYDGSMAEWARDPALPMEQD